MARFEVESNRAGANAVNTPMWQLRTSTASRARVFEIGLSVAGPTAPTVGPTWRLMRATAVGTANVTVTAEEEDPGGPVANTVLDAGWTTPPTLASIGMRRYGTPNTIGSGIVWTWPDHRPLIIPNAAASGIVVVNVVATGAATGSFNMYAIFEE